MRVINLVGAPCTGKSTAAAGLFYLMKTRGYEVELVTEFAKDLHWDGHFNVLADQLFVFAEQHRRLDRLREKVDFVITDTSLLLSAIYKPADYPESFDHLVVDMFNRYENQTFMLHRADWAYNPNGRGQQFAEEAQAREPQIKDFLTRHGIQHLDMAVSRNTPEDILYYVEAPAREAGLAYG